MSDKIKLRIPVKYDNSYSKEMEIGISYGREIEETLEISVDEAQELIQYHVIRKMNYKQGREFIKKYTK